jgi:hypothetical protein
VPGTLHPQSGMQGSEPINKTSTVEFEDLLRFFYYCTERAIDAGRLWSHDRLDGSDAIRLRSLQVENHRSAS